jgi:antitoxin VapB
MLAITDLELAMARQLNIRSDEAYRIAHRVAKQRRKTVTEVVTEALREQHGPADVPREVTPEEAAETIRILRRLSRQGGKRKKPGANSDHSDLYDEFGLPK